MRGYLRKKGKDDSSWKVRLFVLSADNNSLSYYIKDQVCDLNQFQYTWFFNCIETRCWLFQDVRQLKKWFYI